MRLGAWSQALAPGYGICYKCRTPWKFVEGHQTVYFEERGVIGQVELVVHSRSCFPLCEKCWQETPVEERLPYYAEMFATWEAEPETWEQIKAAVEAGL